MARSRTQPASRSDAIGAIGRVWGIDLTGLPLVTGDSVPVWGIVDHGSRTLLQLEPLERSNSLILLGKLLLAMGEYGKPKAIRSDNASVFKTIVFRVALKLLGVQQQFTELHSPWQNGKIERFWRTLKETLGTKVRRFRQDTRILEEQMRFASGEAMKDVLQEFQTFYNFSRPHQSLKGRTPAQVWGDQLQRSKERRNAHADVHKRAKPPDP